jgi:hypothetical protein
MYDATNPTIKTGAAANGAGCSATPGAYWVELGEVVPRSGLRRFHGPRSESGEGGVQRMTLSKPDRTFRSSSSRSATTELCPTGAKVQYQQHRPADVAGSSHSVSVIEVRIDATRGRRLERRRPASSHSDPSSTRLRRVLGMTGAGAHASVGSAPRRRMRRKAVTTCNVDQEAYSSPLWRCSP